MNCRDNGLSRACWWKHRQQAVEFGGGAVSEAGERPARRFAPFDIKEIDLGQKGR
jgi:hypothetical protein